MDIYQGQTVTLSVEFRDVGGALADPNTIALKTRAPGGSVTAYADADIEKDETGKYHKDIDLPVPGEWFWRWQGTGTVNAVSQGSFVVKADNI